MRSVLVVTDDIALAKAIANAVHQDGRVATRVTARSMSIRMSLRRLRPDVVLLDQVGDHAMLVARIREASELDPHAMRVLLATEVDWRQVRSAFADSVHAVISRSVEPASVAPLLRELSRGNVALPLPVEDYATPLDSPLTDRELEILRLAAEGHTNARIGRQLWVTEQTVKFHLSNIYRKLGVANRTQAGRYALDHRLLVTAAPASVPAPAPARLAS